jgi:hypothetical protein
MNITISPQKVARLLTIGVLCLAITGAVAYYTKHFLGRPYAHGLVPLFDLEQESNIPTWYQSALLLLSAGLLAVIATFKKREGDRFTLHWKVLAFAFAFLSADEASGIHELTIAPVESTLQPTGLLYFAWVIPYGILVLVVLAASVRLMAALPAKTRKSFFLAGVLYVGAALVIEMFEAYVNYHYGRGYGGGFLYMTLVITEETMEMMGIVVFVGSLLSYLHAYAKDLVVHISGEKPVRAAVFLPVSRPQVNQPAALDGVGVSASSQPPMIASTIRKHS